MPTFEHLSVLVSIVVGLSVSQVLFGLGQLVRRRGTYEVDALYLLCNLIVLLVLVDSWWAVFSWHDAPKWSYRGTWFVLINPLIVTMAAQFKCLGPGYPITNVTMAVLCVLAALMNNRKIQFVCSVGVLLMVFSWIF